MSPCSPHCHLPKAVKNSENVKGKWQEMEFDNRFIASVVICTVLAVGLIGVGVFGSGPPKKSKPKKARPPVTSANKTTKKTTSTKSTSFSSDTDDSEAESAMRGYKKTSSGKTTTYFNRELSSSDSALLGDITPKRIDSPAATAAGTTSPAPLPTGGSGTGSAWNAAGTWEEKDITEWTKSRISSGLKSVSYTSSTGKAVVASVSGLDGEATVGMSRGKKRYIYDMSVDITWKLEVGCVSVTGCMSVKDISAECCHECYVSGVSSTASNTVVGPLVASHINAETKSLMAAISTELQRVYSDMKSSF